MFDYRQFTDKELKSMFKGIPFSMEPMRHQYITFAHALGEDSRRLMMLHDIGTGKTLTALWTMQFFLKPKKIIVICPRSAFRGWKRDLPQYGRPFAILEGNKEERVDLLEQDKHDVYVVNFEGLKSIYGARKEPIRKGGKRPWYVKHTEFIDGFDGVIIDEMHKCASSGGKIEDVSLQADICYHLSWRAKYVIGLTGTLNPNLEQLWAVTKVIDLGEMLGVNFWNYRKRYFTPDSDGWGGWHPQPDAQERILRELLPIATSFSREECLPDLPGKVEQIREADATKEQQKLFALCMSGLNVELREGTLNAGNIMARTQKLRQIAGGFLYLDDDGQRNVKVLTTNPKLKLLEDVLDETDRKIVIFHEYQEEGRLIEKWAKKEGIKYASLRAEIINREYEEDKFIDTPDCRLMIAHPKCASESLDFTCSNVMVFYSCGDSIIEHIQAMGRIRRKHQHYKQLFIKLVIKNSIDEITTSGIETKAELTQKMLQFIRTFGKVIL